MKVIRFVARADPNPMPRLGAALPQGRVVDLQAAHFAMTGAPNPTLQGPESLLANGGAPDLVRRVAEWALTQDAPGTTLAQEGVRVLDAWDL